MSQQTDDPRPQTGLVEITEEVFRENREKQERERREQAAIISSILDDWKEEDGEPSAPQPRTPTFH